MRKYRKKKYCADDCFQPIAVFIMTYVLCLFKIRFKRFAPERHHLHHPQLAARFLKIITFHTFFKLMAHSKPAVSSVAKCALSVREVWDSIPGPVKSAVSPTTRHRCDVSSELCCPGAKPRRWAPQLVTRFGVIRRV